jgi:diguanylate cyclase (GGDEF)-like protein/putative nucleotidyltransferase with HDIG domain
MRHRLLARQLRKAGIDPDAAEPVDCEALRALLAGVDASYHQADQYRTLQEQALNISSREMAELTERVELDRREQDALRQVATAVAEGRSGADIFRLVADRAGDLLGACAQLVPGGVVPLGTSPIAREVLLGAATCRAILEPGSEDHCVEHLSSLGLRSMAASPIRVADRPWGALAVMFDSDNGVDRRIDGALERFASLTSVAIMNAEAKDRLEHLASRDHLTGLASRRVFQEALGTETGRALDAGGHLALALIDFDDFKLVNDQLGHQAGDEILKTVAVLLGRNSPEDATLARLGGDEFAWLLPGFSAGRAADLIATVQRQLRELDLGPVDMQTISVGVCDLHKAGGEPAELYRMSDGALYSAKRSRPGTCVIYRPDTELPRSVEERRAQLERSRGLQAVRALARAVDARDPLTHSHSERVADLSAALAERIGWDSAQRDALYEAALVHDVGKIGVPDAVLRFPGKLGEEDVDLIRSHATIGAEIVAGLLTDDQVSWVRHHHERWDGAGYPDGVKGLYIPEGARVMAVADTFDAMVNDRPYRKGLSPEEAVSEIGAEGGRQFDPELARALADMWELGHPLLHDPQRVVRVGPDRDVELEVGAG